MGEAVKLLGRPEITYGATYRPAAGKGSAALYYLAYLGDWINRDDLIYLFWPDCDEARARGNLRQLLSAIRRQPFVEQLMIDGDRLRWEIDSDAHAFQMAMSAQDYALAVQKYTGALLLGFHLHGAPEFENWLELERAQLHEQWRRATLSHSAELVETGRANESVTLLERLLQAEPLDEVVLRQLLATLPATEALRRFKRYRAELHRHLGDDPEPETLQLISHISSLNTPSPTAVVTAVNPFASRPSIDRLPHALTPFVGRSGELDLLTVRLLDSDCRLLTILAPGGMGKTRLALEARDRLAVQLRDGVCYVPLVTVNSLDGVAPAIASSLGLGPVQGENPFDLVVTHLRSKAMVLILDNLEHLAGVADTVLELLTAAPFLKVLATSRERLDVQAEWVYDLSGLAFPSSDQEVGVHFDAVQLFVRVASRADRSFSLSPENTHSVSRICQLTGGMPLAIELAASWLRVMTAGHIASELESSLDLLQASVSDLEPRHLSIRAAFDGSWKLLSQAEQQALRKLAVFHGGFTREAARDVAGVGLPLLLALRNKSFLTLDPTGRFIRHPLLAQYLCERAREHIEKLEEARMRHAMYFSAWLESMNRHYGVAGQRLAYKQIEADYANLTAAWHWAVQSRRDELLDRMTYMLNRFLLGRGRYGELKELMDSALAAVESGTRAWAHLNSAEAIRLWHSGQAEEGYRRSQLALGVYRRLGEDASVALSLHRTGVAAARSGRLDEALMLWREGIDIYSKLGDTRMVADMRGNSAVLTVERQEQERLYEAAIAEGRRLHDLDILVFSLNNFALEVAQTYGDFDRAVAMIDEAVELERTDLDNRVQLAGWLIASSGLRISSGQLTIAEQHAHEALALMAEFDSTRACDLRERAYGNLAYVHLLRDNLELARFLAAENLTATRNSTHLQLLARLALESGENRQAREQLAESLKQIAEFGERSKFYVRAKGLLLLAEANRDQTQLAVTNLTAALETGHRFTFLPVLLEGFVVAAPLLPPAKAAELCAISATHPAATFETRKRARQLTAFSGQMSDDSPVSAARIHAIAREVIQFVT